MGIESLKTQNSALQQCDHFVRDGNLRAARLIFAKIDARRLLREQRTFAAQLARRLGRIDQGLRILHPYLHPKRGAPSALETERAEFANLLCLNGNVEEALSLLPQPSETESFLAKAWCHFETWDYEAALPLLRSYIPRQRDPYYQNAGRINLAEALHALGDWDEALENLAVAIEFSKRGGHRRLLANALHVRSQGNAARGRLARSDADLAAAKTLFGDEVTADAFLIRRQSAFNDAIKNRDLSTLARIEAEASQLGQWESLREIEFQKLRIQFSQPLFAKLYFGTPHEKFRERICRHFQEQPDADYVWGSSPGPEVRPPPQTADIRAPTPVLQRLLKQLLDDFYVPASAGRIFAGVFFREHYDWHTSPNKVHQAISRLREWIRKERWPLEIREARSFYTLHPTGPISIRLGAERRSERSVGESLASRFQNEFTAGDARAFLQLPKTSVHRWLREAIADGSIEPSGTGRATRYRFKKPEVGPLLRASRKSR